MEEKQKVGVISRTGWWVIFATISGSAMVFIMQSALNVALPAIQNDFAASGADQVWIVNSYQLLLAALLLLGGSLGDLYGRKRIYIIGILIFTLASVISGFASNTQILIGARALQGIGGALMVPGSLAIVSAYFDDSIRGKAIGIWSSATIAASLFAPLLGGFLADAGLWRFIFFLTVPIAAIALYALITHVPESHDEDAPPGIDYAGAILIALALIGIVYGTTEIGRGGEFRFDDPLIIGSIIGGIIALFLFIYVESRSSHPMLPLKLFQSRSFSGVNLQTFFLYGSLGVFFFFVPLNLQQIQGYSATIAGLSGLPVIILMIFMSPWAGGLIDRVGPRPPLIMGSIIVGFGYIALALPGVTNGVSDYWFTYFPGLIILGIGLGIIVAPLTTTALGSVPQHNAGVASAVNNLMSRASGTVATAILGGVALITFANVLQTNIIDIPILPENEILLIENSKEFSGTQVPESMEDTETISEVESAIDWAFVYVFRMMAIIAAIMSWISAAIAAVMIEPRLDAHNELDKIPNT
jgi:EmrB/QacA subfamily drug resistance transporter